MIGLAEVSLNHHERASLLAHGIPSIDRQPLHELARIALLLHGITQIPHETHADFMWNLFLRGDTAERTALLRGLSVLPNPIRFLDIAVYACSTNIQTIFEAIACENPYPVRFFQELNFNQLVMKALFIDLSVSRIVGLSERISPALRQMVVDHVNERIAAGRLVHQGAIMILNS